VDLDAVRRASVSMLSSSSSPDSIGGWRELTNVPTP